MLQWMTELWTKFAEAIVQVLPLSPFRETINSWAGVPPQGIAWLNWLVPVNGILTILAAWLSAYVLYLLASIVLRWLKAVQ